MDSRDDPPPESAGMYSKLPGSGPDKPAVGVEVGVEAGGVEGDPGEAGVGVGGSVIPPLVFDSIATISRIL